MAQNCQVFGTLTGLNGLYTLSPMPIHLIIDGYNLLGVRGGLRGDVEARREQLIRDLAGYRQRKGHPVTVIFDGWRAGHPVERAEWREGLEVDRKSTRLNSSHLVNSYAVFFFKK